MSPASWFTNALSILREGKSLVMATVVGPGKHPRFGDHAVLDPSNRSDATGTAFGVVDSEVWDKLIQALAQGHIAVLRSFDSSGLDSHAHPSRIDVFMTWCGPPPEAWIFGAGHIGQALAPLLAHLGWQVVVCDDRAEFLTSARFPEVRECRVDDFRISAAACAGRPDVWAVLVTRGHQHDEMILRALRHGSPRYVGMIGSRRRIDTVRKRLIAEGTDRGFLEKLHAPIGLPINADSPIEIAVAIAGEMIAVRRGAGPGPVVPGAIASGSADSQELLGLWEQTASRIESGSRAVLATIVSRRGSTPRGLGAKMAVFADGTSIGTIGGGCGEGIVLHAAKEMLLTGDASRLIEVDLSGDDAAETADVCGGQYSVFLTALA